MTRVFITGDIHGSLDISKLNTKRFPEQKNLTKDDIVIIAGDFGFPWVVGEDREDAYWLNWLNRKPFTTVYIDGNHENFDAIKTYPETIFRGAACHQLRPSVYHVKRGEILSTPHHQILCMGGAISTDKIYRKNHISWWSEEEPSYEEWQHAFKNLKHADIIISHDGPTSFIDKLNINTPTSVNRSFEIMLENIQVNDIPVKKWFIGHHHIDKEFKINDIDTYFIYNDIIELD